MTQEFTNNAPFGAWALASLGTASDTPRKQAVPRMLSKCHVGGLPRQHTPPCLQNGGVHTKASRRDSSEATERYSMAVAPTPSSAACAASFGSRSTSLWVCVFGENLKKRRTIKIFKTRESRERTIESGISKCLSIKESAETPARMKCLLQLLPNYQGALTALAYYFRGLSLTLSVSVSLSVCLSVCLSLSLCVCVERSAALCACEL